MKIVVREEAVEDVARLYEWIAKDNPAAATRMVERTYKKINHLVDSLAEMGRPGRVRGTRELVERPYVITYEVDDRFQTISVVSIVHGARRF